MQIVIETILLFLAIPAIIGGVIAVVMHNKKSPKNHDN